MRFFKDRYYYSKGNLPMSRFTRDDDINRELRRLLAITEVNAYPYRLYVPNSTTNYRVWVDSSGNVYIGDTAGNYTKFEADGTFVAYGNAITWRDHQVDWGQLSSGSWFGNEYAQLVELGSGIAIEFKKDSSNYYKTRFNCQIDHDYAEGEDIEFHVHIRDDSNTSGNVVFKLTYEWANMEAVFPSSSSSTKTVTIDGSSGKHQYETILTASGTGKEISSILMCQLERLAGDANDTFNESVYVIGVDFHVPCNMNGSRTMMTK